MGGDLGGFIEPQREPTQGWQQTEQSPKLEGTAGWNGGNGRRQGWMEGIEEIWTQEGVR